MIMEQEMVEYNNSEKNANIMTMRFSVEISS